MDMFLGFESTKIEKETHCIHSKNLERVLERERRLNLLCNPPVCGEIGQSTSVTSEDRV